MLEEYDSEDEFEPSQFIKPSYICLLIDTHETMFIKNEDGIAPFKMCLKACYNLLDKMVISKSKGTQLAILLSKKDEKDSILIDFKENILEAIERINQELALSEQDLKQKYMTTDVDLSMMFLMCKKKFESTTSAFYQRILIYITNNSIPTMDEHIKFSIMNQAQTFKSCKIKFELISTNENFNYELFYNEMLSICCEDEIVKIFCLDELGLEDKLNQSLAACNVSKVNFYPFKDDETRYLKCVKFSCFKNKKLYNDTYLDDEGNLLTKTKINPVTSDPNYILKALRHAALSFDNIEVSAILANSLPKGYTLFSVSKEILPYGMIANKIALIHVDSEETLPFFDHFWQYCVDNNKVLICFQKLRKNEKPKYVQLKPIFANKKKMFVIKEIPYYNSIIYPSKIDYELEGITEERKGAVNKLIDNLDFQYNPEIFQNLAYEKKAHYVKAKLLGQPESSFNETTVKKEALDEKITKEVSQIRNLFELGGKKRKK